LRLPLERDVGDSYVHITAAGRTEVFFEQNRCLRPETRSNIFKLRFF
jgi:hypothetical protein